MLFSWELFSPSRVCAEMNFTKAKQFHAVSRVLFIYLFIFIIYHTTKMLIKIIAASQDGFIVPYVWEIVVRKNLTNFEGCHFARFYILIWWSFLKIETKNFNSGPCFFKLVKLRTISPAAHFPNTWEEARR